MTPRSSLPLILVLAAVSLNAAAAPPKAKPAAAPKPKAAAAKAKPDAKNAARKPRPMTLATVGGGAKAMMVGFGAAGGHFVVARPKGGLEASGKSADAAATFQLLDLNGGALQNGDKVQIAMAGAGRPSFWQEVKGKIHRTGDHPDASCTFTAKWIKKDTSLTLQTASKQYVSAPAAGGALATTAKATDPTAVFTLVKKK